MPTPPGFSDSSPFTAQVNGVTWFQHETGDVVVWTAILRGLNVELTVPKHYEGQGAFLVDLSDVIRASGLA